MKEAFKLKNGSILLVAESPGGLYNAEQLKAVAEMSDQNEVVMVRALEDQRLGLVIKDEKLDAVKQTLAEVGLTVRHYQHSFHQPVACMGSACPDAQQDALGISMQIAAIESNYDVDEPLKIGINGCQKSCVPSHALDVSIVGEQNGYRLSLGGKNSLFPEFATYMAHGIPEAELPSLVEKVIEVYVEKREEGETFHDVIERLGITLFTSVLHPYSQDAGAGDLDLTALANQEEATEDAADSSEINFDDLPHVDELPTEDEVSGDEAPLSSEASEMSEITEEEVSLLDDLDIPTEDESADVSLEVDEVSEDVPLADDENLDQVDSISLDDIEPEQIEAETEEIDVKGIVDEALPDDSSESEDLEIDGSEFEEEISEDLLEEKITQSIQEESLITYDDKSDKHRLQALQMVEQDTEEISEPEHIDFEADEVLGDFEVNLTDDLNLEEDDSRSSNGFAIQNVNQDGTKVIINFSTGASVAIDIEQLKSMSGRMELVLNKQKVSIVESDGLITLKSNGFEFRLPCQNAA